MMVLLDFTDIRIQVLIRSYIYVSLIFKYFSDLDRMISVDKIRY